jgi:hypothetical protein
MKIVFGVEDFSYAAESYKRAGVRKRKRPKRDSSKTTKQVAAILEKRYGIMEFFAEKYSDDIAEAMLEVYEPIIGNLDEGDPLNLEHVGLPKDIAERLEEKFRNMIKNREMDGQPGVPTAASAGYTKRNGKRVRRRPSFDDTGLYIASFRAWSEDS